MLAFAFSVRRALVLINKRSLQSVKITKHNVAAAISFNNPQMTVLMASRG